jgi:membrane protease YdiL (CAAX protease family)
MELAAKTRWVYRRCVSDQLPILTDASPIEALYEHVRASERMRWLELALLLSISFGQYFFVSLYTLITGLINMAGSQDYQWALTFFHEAMALLLLGYILSRRKARFADLGLRWSTGDLIRGAGVAIGSYCAYFAGNVIVHGIHRAILGDSHSGNTAQAIFGHPGFFAIPFFLLNPFFEEMIVRAYLMTEIRELTRSATLAVALSVAVQTAYHLYYGWEGALSLGFQFLFFAVYYAKTRRATPIIVAHGVFDLIGLARLW